ncbi:TlpA family protein disulfide reductase [Pedobacter sp. ISL-68]|uniref:TlpA family protein disulfide reductase n=1 Tax=unclassified Pedobacter TaxID=2628915 RepID=UPI001BE82CB8|nr:MULTISPECIES: TlpA disulfide reductase family protein [unclassified Pedobacter]MBT2559849.1 TlpA family protein disulfide reductase [Pedobacter sp. ISL-64]MBT2592154.1 TlpA family protein disulfide reductase [Pedobacter sp. ISL-68]
MKSIFKSGLFITLILSFTLSIAQSIKPLNVGDKVPDIYFATMLNHTSTNGKLSDFNGKAIIIDVWFKECIPCVSNMRHLDSLQSEYANDLKILPVTWQSKEEIERFWRTNLNVTGIKLTQSVNDKLVRKIFPAVSFPHQIWIDKNGTIVAITDGKNTSRENVKKLIENKSLTLAEKKDELDASVRYAHNPDLTIRYEENKNKLLYYSYFSSWRSELAGMSRSNVDKATGRVRITANNLSLVYLYDFAYTNNSYQTRHDPTRVIRRDHNPVKSWLEGTFDTTRLFCYDLIYKGTTTKGFSKYMIADLDRAFGVKSHEIIMDIPCYVICMKGGGTKFRQAIVSEGEAQIKNPSMKKDVVLVVNKKTVSAVERAINQYGKDLVLFEMGDEKIINFQVKWNTDDLSFMNKELEKFDLKIEKTTRKRKVIILEDA